MQTPRYLELRIDPRTDPLRRCQTLGPHVYHDAATGLRVEIPGGFRCDLTSGIRWLGRFLLASWLVLYFFPGLIWYLYAVATFVIIFRDAFGVHQWPSLLHDFLYYSGWPKLQADAIYYRALKLNHARCWRTWVSYSGVLVFGWPSYWRNQYQRSKRQKGY